MGVEFRKFAWEFREQLGTSAYLGGLFSCGKVRTSRIFNFQLSKTDRNLDVIMECLSGELLNDFPSIAEDIKTVETLNKSFPRTEL